MAEAAVATYGGIDGLVNNAALFGGIKHEPLLHRDFDYYLKVCNINMHRTLRGGVPGGLEPFPQACSFSQPATISSMSAGLKKASGCCASPQSDQESAGSQSVPISHASSSRI